MYLAGCRTGGGDRTQLRLRHCQVTVRCDPLLHPHLLIQKLPISMRRRRGSHWFHSRSFQGERSAPRSRMCHSCGKPSEIRSGEDIHMHLVVKSCSVYAITCSTQRSSHISRVWRVSASRVSCEIGWTSPLRRCSVLKSVAIYCIQLEDAV